MLYKRIVIPMQYYMKLNISIHNTAWRAPIASTAMGGIMVSLLCMGPCTPLLACTGALPVAGSIAQRRPAWSMISFAQHVESAPLSVPFSSMGGKLWALATECKVWVHSVQPRKRSLIIGIKNCSCCLPQKCNRLHHIFLRETHTIVQEGNGSIDCCFFQCLTINAWSIPPIRQCMLPTCRCSCSTS